MAHEVVPGVVVAVEVASLYEGLQLPVLPVKDEELTVKPVGPGKTESLGRQLHETDHLLKRGIMGTTHISGLGSGFDSS